MPAENPVAKAAAPPDPQKIVLANDWLRTWVRPSHLEPQAMADYGRRFNAQPAPFLVIDHFLPDALAEQVSQFLAVEAKFRRSIGLYTAFGECTLEAWEAATEEQRFFSFRVLDESQWGDTLTPAASAYVRLRKAFGEPQFADYFAKMTGLTLGYETEVGTHGLLPGDFLKTHCDSGHNRMLAFLIYLTPGWRTEYGGALHLFDRDGVESPIEPLYNRLAIFDVIANRDHYVAQVTAPEGCNRLSLGGWFHNP